MKEDSLYYTKSAKILCRLLNKKGNFCVRRKVSSFVQKAYSDLYYAGYNISNQSYSDHTKLGIYVLNLILQDKLKNIDTKTWDDDIKSFTKNLIKTFYQKSLTLMKYQQRIMPKQKSLTAIVPKKEIIVFADGKKKTWFESLVNKIKKIL